MNLIKLGSNIYIVDIKCLLQNGKSNGQRVRRKCGRSVVDPWSGHTNDYRIGMCCFSAKHTQHKGVKAKTGWNYRNPTWRVGLEQSGHHHQHHLIKI